MDEIHAGHAAKTHGVIFCIAKEFDVTRSAKMLYGAVHIRPDAIDLVRDHRLSPGAMGAAGALGGAVGGLIAGAVSAARQRKAPDSWQVIPQETTAYCDSRRRVVSLGLPDGTWFVARLLPSGLFWPGRDKFDAFVEDLRSVYGERLQEAELGKCSAGVRAAFWVLIVCGVLFIACLTILLIAESVR